MTVQIQPPRSAAVVNKLQELAARVCITNSVDLIWDRVFDESDRLRLVNETESDDEKFCPLTMWRKVFGVSKMRALIDAGRALGFLTAHEHRWLLRETGEADGRLQMVKAIDSGALVLSEERKAYFAKVPIKIDWYKQNNSWNFLWELAEHSKRGKPFDHFALGEFATPKTFANRKNRVKNLLPPKLFKLFGQEPQRGCRIDLPPDKIRLFIFDDQEELVEWVGRDFAGG